MNRVIVLRMPGGDEEILAHFVLKSSITGKYLEATFPHRSYPEILHFSLRKRELVLQSSSNVELSLIFLPMWNIERRGVSCKVVHGDDLLDLVHRECIDSGLM